MSGRHAANRPVYSATRRSGSVSAILATRPALVTSAYSFTKLNESLDYVNSSKSYLTLMRIKVTQSAR